MLLYHGFANKVEGTTIYTHLTENDEEITFDLIGINGLGRRKTVQKGEILILDSGHYQVSRIIPVQLPSVNAIPAGLFLGRAVAELSKI
jgi:hypothetical protein